MSGNEKKAAEVFKYLNDGLLYNWTHRSAEPETLMWRKNTSCGGTRLPEEGRGPHCFLDADWPPHHTTRAEVVGNHRVKRLVMSWGPLECKVRTGSLSNTMGPT